MARRSVSRSVKITCSQVSVMQSLRLERNYQSPVPSYWHKELLCEITEPWLDASSLKPRDHWARSSLSDGRMRLAIWDLRRSLGPRFSLGCLKTARTWAHRPQTTGQTWAPGALRSHAIPHPLTSASHWDTRDSWAHELTPNIIAFSAQELVCQSELFSRHLLGILLLMDESLMEVTWCSVMSCSGTLSQLQTENWTKWLRNITKQTEARAAMDVQICDFN